MPTVNPPPTDDSLTLEYDPATRRLTVAPAGGGGGEAVVYRRVPRAVYEALARASSKGRFLATHIRPRYPTA